SIRDNKPTQALIQLAQLSPTALRKKPKKTKVVFYRLANLCFLVALTNGMDTVAIEMINRGFPTDVNDEMMKSPLGEGVFPSFFLCAVAMGLETIVRAMIKVYAYEKKLELVASSFDIHHSFNLYSGLTLTKRGS